MAIFLWCFAKYINHKTCSTNLLMVNSENWTVSHFELIGEVRNLRSSPSSFSNFADVSLALNLYFSFRLPLCGKRPSEAVSETSGFSISSLLEHASSIALDRWCRGLFGNATARLTATTIQRWWRTEITVCTTGWSIICRTRPRWAV